MIFAQREFLADSTRCVLTKRNVRLLKDILFAQREVVAYQKRSVLTNRNVRLLKDMILQKERFEVTEKGMFLLKDMGY